MTDTSVQNRSGLPEAQASVLQHDYVLLDGSSSMQNKWWDSLAAIQAYLDAARLGGVKSLVTVHVFDDVDMEYLPIENKPIADVNLYADPIGAHWGSTPLYDAIERLGHRLNKLNPPRASILIVTDGEENASEFADLQRARVILDWLRAKGYQITFIGAEFDNATQAELLGANAASAIGVQPKMLKATAEALGKKRARYATTGQDMHFSDDEKQQFGGYLPGK